MADQVTISSETVIWISVISASSAIIAASVTQLITAQNIRKNEERKEAAEYKKSNSDKIVAIGESFYHLFRETLLSNHRLKNELLTEKETVTLQSIDYLENQVKTINDITYRLIADTAKHNLTEIYFNIESSTTVTAKDVAMLTHLMAKKMELLAGYYDAVEEEQDLIKFEVVEIQEGLIRYIEKITARIERDLNVIKKELISLNS